MSTSCSASTPRRLRQGDRDRAVCGRFDQDRHVHREGRCRRDATPDPDLATEEELKQLEDAIAKAEAEKLNQDDYTADSWKAYANALAQAKKVLAKENATSTEVQDAIRHLTEPARPS